MDVNKLEEAQKLIKKSNAAQVVNTYLKQLAASKDTPFTAEINESLQIISSDLVMKCIALKAEYDRAFDTL